MMRSYIGLIVLFSTIIFNFTLSGQTQETEIENDTIVYDVVKEMPRFPACEALDTTIAFKNACAQKALLAFMNQNIQYPFEARQKNASGMVVVKFVVEKDGSISSPEILKDVEGGCGLEVLRIVGAMNQANIKWVPGKVEGKPVRAYFTLPIRFKLEEAPPFTIIGTDSVWVEFERPLSFKGGDEALTNYLKNTVKYPDSGNDSCAIGKMEVKLIVDRSEKVRILDMVDLNGLGFDFWYAATDAITSTIGKWEIATFDGQSVPAAYDITLSFIPEVASCKSEVDKYNQAIALMNEGSNIFGEGEQEKGLEKMSEAIALFPDDSELLMVRGQAYLDNNDFLNACTDLSKVKEIAVVDWYDDLLQIICKFKQ